MTDFLIRKFVPNYTETSKKEVRKSYVTLSSIVGAAANLLLFVLKLFLGIFAGSLSVMADAFNNLSDMSSCVVTFLGFHLSAKPADKDHPFGHGRYEYLSGLFIGILILLVAFELLKSSVEKIFHPSSVAASPLVLILLGVTVLAKIMLGAFYAKIGKTIGAVAVSAGARDSFSDAVTTAVTLLSVALSPLTSLPIDGYLGVLISVFILFAGFGIIKDTVNPLLGEAPSEDTVKAIKEKMLAADYVSGVHDLMVHNYGPGRIFASAHAEVPTDADIIKVHDAIDCMEREIYDDLDILMTIHLDPVTTDDEVTLSLQNMVLWIAREIHPEFSVHDFRVVQGDTHTNLIFDLVVPHGLKMTHQEIKERLDAQIEAHLPNHFTVITFDSSYI